MRTGFPAPPLMPITKPGSLTTISLTALNTKKMRLESSRPLLARPAKGKGRKPQTEASSANKVSHSSPIKLYRKKGDLF